MSGEIESAHLPAMAQDPHRAERRSASAAGRRGGTGSIHAGRRSPGRIQFSDTALHRQPLFVQAAHDCTGPPAKVGSLLVLRRGGWYCRRRPRRTGKIEPPMTNHEIPMPQDQEITTDFAEAWISCSPSALRVIRGCCSSLGLALSAAASRGRAGVHRALCAREPRRLVHRPVRRQEARARRSGPRCSSGSASRSSPTTSGPSTFRRSTPRSRR